MVVRRGRIDADGGGGEILVMVEMMNDSGTL